MSKKKSADKPKVKKKFEKKSYQHPQVGLICVKNSADKSNKHIKRGRKGKTCIYFDIDKLTCKNETSGYYHQFCRDSNACQSYKVKEEKKPHGKTRTKYNDIYTPEPWQSGTHERTNEYIGVSKNIGTPCHVGYIKSDGIRRHKTRCIYYNKIEKWCKYYLFKCIGSSKCERYTE